MPESTLPNKIKQADYDAAKTELTRGRTFPEDRDFDWNQEINLPIADKAPADPPKKWRGISIELAAIVVGRPTPANDEDDEPFYLGQGSTPGGPKLVRWPSNAGDAPSVKALDRKGVRRVVAYHDSLDREGTVRVQAQAAAYEEDFDAIWNDLLDAIRSDAKNAAEFGLAQAPGLSAFGLQTPGAAVGALTGLLPTFQSNQVGGDIRVLDTGRKHWWKKGSGTVWEARKITLHTSRMSEAAVDDADANEKPGWYLAEWIISLGCEARSYGVAGLMKSDPPLLDPDGGLQHAVALRIVRGEDVGEIAEEFGIPLGEVSLAATGLADLRSNQLESLATSGLAKEMELLRKKSLETLG